MGRGIKPFHPPDWDVARREPSPLPYTVQVATRQIRGRVNNAVACAKEDAQGPPEHPPLGRATDQYRASAVCPNHLERINRLACPFCVSRPTAAQRDSGSVTESFGCRLDVTCPPCIMHMMHLCVPGSPYAPPGAPPCGTRLAALQKHVAVRISACVSPRVHSCSFWRCPLGRGSARALAHLGYSSALFGWFVTALLVAADLDCSCRFAATQHLFSRACTY